MEETPHIPKYCCLTCWCYSHYGWFVARFGWLDSFHSAAVYSEKIEINKAANNYHTNKSTIVDLGPCSTSFD